MKYNNLPKIHTVFVMAMMILFSASGLVGTAQPVLRTGLSIQETDTTTPQATSSPSEEDNAENEFDVPTVKTEDGIRWAITGEYINDTYGYSVSIPPGMTGLGTLPPFPNHGFLLRLSTAPKAEIWFDGSYNAQGHDSVDEAAAELMRYCEEDARGMMVLKQTAIQWCGIPARHCVLRYIDLGSGELRIRDLWIAMEKSQSEGECQVVYSATLDTLASRYETDRKVFRNVLKTWKLVPLDVEDGETLAQR